MVFSSTIFLFLFLPVLLAVYYVVAERYRNFVLLLASLFFYSWGEPKNIIVMLLSIGINYLFGLLVGREWKGKKFFLIISIVFNIAVLFVFKYFNFTVDTFNWLTGCELSIREIALPIGISFYTFQIMSYVIDVYRQEVEVQKNVINLGLYISLFPQLIAGPIVRYSDIEKQIMNRTVTWDKATVGVTRFMVGFSKKVLIADQLAPLVDAAFAGDYPSLITRWVGMIAYTLQIYFDFSGYSDMAIGLGKLFGFDFLENFNYPYISQSIQEFWRRWHMSLSSWFKDYLYIPLGGSRKGTGRTYLNLIIVFFVTGLWHGASFNFIVWGLYYAVFLVLERIGFKKILDKLPRVLRHIYSVIVIMIGWVFFRADNLQLACNYVKGLFVPSGNDFLNFNFTMNGQYLFVLIAGIIFSIPYLKLSEWIRKYKYMELVSEIVLILIFLIAICWMVGSGYSPFLYFRF